MTSLTTAPVRATPAPAFPLRAVGARERADLLGALSAVRGLLRGAVGGLTDAQAVRPGPLGGGTLAALVQQASVGEQRWVDVLVPGAPALPGGTPRPVEPGLVGVLDGYEAVARRTEALVLALPDLDAEHALPGSTGERRSARRVLLQVLAETAQHAGLAGLTRAALDDAGA